MFQHDLDYPGQPELREEKEKEKRQRLAGHHADTAQEQTVGQGMDVLCIMCHVILPIVQKLNAKWEDGGSLQSI